MSWYCGAPNCRTHSSPEDPCPNWRLSAISGSVGQGGRNLAADVRVIQGALNRVAAEAGGPSPRLATSGVPDTATVAAIRQFQRVFFGSLSPDGRVDVAGRTYRALARRLDVNRLEVLLADQMVEARHNGQRLYQFPCVSGDAAHPTDAGVFSILRKQHPCRSRTYNVDMNYAMFFTRDGKAIHQYHGPAPLSWVRAGRQMSDWFGSHGCVRLEEADARTLYNWASVGIRVTVR